MKVWTEARLTQALLAEARLKGFVSIKRNDHSTSGIPDATITGLGRTCWIEVKYANPSFKSHGLQELTACRLALAGLCIYVIYDGPRNTVSIVAPKDLGQWREATQKAEGMNHSWVVEQIRELCR